MEGTGGAEGEEIEAEIRKQKAQAKKQRHNVTCRLSRLKKKMIHKERDQEFLKLQADHKRIKIKQEYQAETLMEYQGKLQSLEDDNQILRANHHNMKGSLERTRQIAVELMNFHGHNFASFDQAVVWFTLQNYAGGGQVPRASEIGLQTCNMFTDQDNTNGPAYTANHASSSAPVWINFAAGSSLGASHNLPECDAINNHNNLCNGDLAAVWTNSAAGSSLGASHNLPEYGAMNNHNNLCNRDLAAVWTNSAAGSSLGASHNLPENGAMNNHNNLCNRDLAAGVMTVTDSLPAANPTLVFGSTNNHEKDDDFSCFLEALLES